MKTDGAAGAPGVRPRAVVGLSITFRPRQVAGMATGKNQGTSIGTRLARPFVNGWRFLKDVYAELQRVVWPSHEETYSFTVVVILAVAAVAAWVGVLDFVMANVMKILGIAG
jgi:preprotein translocase SecE subunit